ncbi:MAG: ABC transporter permease [Actinomycetota bacterium]|nr:ABC transporter permease [Actinomycetota bacterium]
MSGAPQERQSTLLFVGGCIVAVLAVVAVLAPVLAPYDPRALTGDSLQAPSLRHLLGTNDVGRDIFSELIWGARTSLIVALGASVVAIAVGVAVGVGAGLIGGSVDFFAMRAVDVLMAVPVLPLLILVAALAGPSRATVIVVIGLLGWPQIARIIRSQTLSLRQRGFVQVSRSFGSPAYVARLHLVPALSPVIVANFVYIAATTVLLEAGLAFLGLGDPLAVSWGQMLYRALLYPGLYFSALWIWWLIPAGLAITLAVLGFTFLGVGLEPRFNPRWSRGL